MLIISGVVQSVANLLLPLFHRLLVLLIRPPPLLPPQLPLPPPLRLPLHLDQRMCVLLQGPA